MSHTIAHRPHAHHHVPVKPIIAVIVAVAVAAVVIWAINQPQTATVTSITEAAPALYVQPAAIVTAPDSPVFRHAQMRVLQHDGYSQAYLAGRLHQVDGTTLDPVNTAPYVPSGGVREFGEFRSSR
jgi:hypothetical protein